MRARFQDCNSWCQASLCLLYTDEGVYLGQVWWNNDRKWVWETADAGDEDTENRGIEKTRRLAKRALRKRLKEKGQL